MRVMTREKNQGVIIGDNVFVRVLAIRGDRVQLEISYPNAESSQVSDPAGQIVSIELPKEAVQALEIVG